MIVSIIICTYNRCKSLHNALQSIISSPVEAHESVEILVIDNNSSDATADIVKGLINDSPFSIKYFVERKQGLSHARNRGISEASGEVLVFADDDVIVSPHWVSTIRATFEDPAVCCAGGKIVPLWEKRCPRWLTADLHRHLALLDLGDRKLRMTEPHLWGANLAFRASVFSRYGTFDTSLGRTAGKLYGNEETDFLKALITSGEGVFYVPEMQVQHCIGANRMKKSYFRKWMFDGGELEGLQMGHYPRRNLFGVPYYILKEAVRMAGTCLTETVNRTERRFMKELALVRMAGFIRGRVKVHRADRLREG